ncbi:MAG: hypothetical protein FWH18_03560 [Marinilabiliaceae bacterium]|nr:hypothetical protein [Marinilabiliaceae bacterium]
MKKIFFGLFGIFLIINNLQAQDLIVTNSGDSLNCKITKITKDYVYFTFKHNEEIRNTLLPTNQISEQQKEYFLESELPVKYTYKAKFPHFRVAVDGGWQYRTAKLVEGIDPTLQNHYIKMKSGFHYDLHAAFFFIESLGVEVMFSQQLFGNSLGYGSLTDIDGYLIGEGVFNEKMSFNYIGANFLCRLFNSTKKNNWLFSVGFGYMGYNDRLLFDNVERLKVTAVTFGTYMAVGYDIGISDNFGIGLKISTISGFFSNYTQTRDGITTNETMPENTFEGLGTVKLSIGLRFNL